MCSCQTLHSVVRIPGMPFTTSYTGGKHKCNKLDRKCIELEYSPQCIGLAKQFVQGFPYAVMGESEQTFWPTQHIYSYNGILPATERAGHPGQRKTLMWHRGAVSGRTGTEACVLCNREAHRLFPEECNTLAGVLGSS